MSDKNIVTDKELLTFCNLANLEMEYANIVRRYENKGNDENGNPIKIPINHTIYTKILNQLKILCYNNVKKGWENVKK